MAKDITLNNIIPKTMTIFGEKYRIRQVKELYSEDGQQLMGCVFYEQKTICLDKTLSDFDKLHTFLHEVFHAVIAETGLSGTIGSKLEEPVVDNMSKTTSKFIARLLRRMVKQLDAPKT